MPQSAPAQSVPIPETSWRPIGFVPEGWKLYDKVDGDLNADGLDDTVLVIQRNDPAFVISNPGGLGMDSFDRNPRMVLVIFQSEAGQYRLVARNALIIPDHSVPTISDPYEGMAVRDGKFHLHLTFFASAGAWTMFNRLFQFRWNGEEMALIGFDLNEVHRASGRMKQTSVNYLTGRRQDTVGSIEDEGEPVWQWSDLPRTHRPTLSDIGDGFEFEG